MSLLQFQLVFLAAALLRAAAAKPGSAWDLGIPGWGSSAVQAASEPDLFRCVNPTGALFDQFLKQYNRTVRGADDYQERASLFSVSLRRAIILNRIIQNEFLNASNYEPANPKRSIGNYYFITPVNKRNQALWYADINDCELGLIKHMLFDILNLLDKNEFELAYKVALDNSAHLPILEADGFEQIANILLVRLYDRFREDQKMNQLFSWPIYLKKLAAFAYNRRQMAHPEAKLKLSLVSFVYPAYFTDLRYNAPAIDRTQDNIRMHEDHEKFNQLLRRRFANLAERNRRLATYRQRWTLVNLLNEDPTRWQNLSQPAEWTRVENVASYVGPQSERYRLTDSAELGQEEAELATQERFKQTQFSDLTDAEFVAYLSQDYSLLGHDSGAAAYLDRNFPVRTLDDKLRNEIAAELELRRMTGSRAGSQLKSGPSRESVALARRVIDELISEVGLPVGPVELPEVSREDSVPYFERIATVYRKTYLDRSSAEPSLRDEGQARLEQFVANLPKFRAWWIKEGWGSLNEEQLPMLRMADMSWNEIKMVLFKLCCVHKANMAELAASNATLAYLASHEHLCQPLSSAGELTQSSTQTQSELLALELYYYYLVHFNKHHTNMVEFERRFEIFRQNIDYIRRQSCMRGLSLFTSLESRNFATLSTVDVLDPRRSRTDDINLDRFKYFQVPNLNSNSNSNSNTLGYRSSPMSSSRPEVVDSGRSDSNSRMGISYRRSPFSHLSGQVAPNRKPNSGPPYAERLLNSTEDVNAQVERYRQMGVARIYDLVHERYRYCTQTLRHIELPDDFELRNFYCKSSGPLGDKATQNWKVENLMNRAANLAQAQQEDQCAFYRHGLEPWSEGLIRQQELAAHLIEAAKC